MQRKLLVLNFGALVLLRYPVAIESITTVLPFDTSDDSLAEQLSKVCQDGYGMLDIPALKPLLQKVHSMGREFLTYPFDQHEMMISPFGGCYEVGGEMTDGIADPRAGCYLFDYPYTSLGVSELYNQSRPDFSKVRGLGDAISDLRRLLTAVTNQLAKAISLSLNLPANFMEDRYLLPEPYGQILLSKYITKATPTMSLPDKIGDWGIGGHRDYGFFAFIFQPHIGGLQFQRRDGAWLDVLVQPEQLSFLVGETLELVTNGYCRAVPHRVLRPETEDRFAITSFVNPALSAVLYPGEACRGEVCCRAKQVGNGCGMSDDLKDLAQKAPFYWEDYETYTYKRMFAHSYTDTSYHALEFNPRKVTTRVESEL